MGLEPTGGSHILHKLLFRKSHGTQESIQGERLKKIQTFEETEGNKVEYWTSTPWLKYQRRKLEHIPILKKSGVRKYGEF